MQLFQKFLNEPVFAFKFILGKVFQKISPITSKYFKGYALPFSSVFFILNWECNLKCAYCYLWGDNGIAKTQSFSFNKNIDEWQKAVELLPFYVAEVILMGGEPLLNNQWWKTAKLCKEKKLKVNLISNGSFLKENYENILNYVDCLVISVDGDINYHNTIRGKSSYEKIIEGLELINKNINYKLQIKISLCLTSLNENNVIKFIKSFPFAKYKINTLEINLLEYQDEGQNYANKRIASHPVDARNDSESSMLNDNWNNILKNKSKINFWSGFSNKYQITNFNLLKELIQVKNQAKDLNIIFSDLQFKKYGQDNFQPQDCGNIFSKLYILPDGEVWSCPQINLGNIKEKNFNEIWNRKILKQIRREITNKNFCTYCRNCSASY